MSVRPLTKEADVDVIAQLFHTRRSKKAAGIFLGWFRLRKGRATRREMNRFGHELEAGRLGFKYAHTAFYRYVLRAFLDHRLIGLEAEIDHTSRRVVKVYKRILQPTQKRRPSGPSLIYDAHRLAEEWNAIFDG